jgi:hypothetical protein
MGRKGIISFKNVRKGRVETKFEEGPCLIKQLEKNTSLTKHTAGEPLNNLRDYSFLC